MKIRPYSCNKSQLSFNVTRIHILQNTEYAQVFRQAVYKRQKTHSWLSYKCHLSTSNQRHLIASDSNATVYLLTCGVCAQRLKAVFSLTHIVAGRREEGRETREGPMQASWAPNHNTEPWLSSRPNLKTEPHPHRDSHSPRDIRTQTQTYTYIHKYTPRHKQA